MKKFLLFGLMAALAVGLAAPVWAKNITIFDTVTGTSSNTTYNAWWNNSNEDQEVEPGCEIGQNWDMEAFVVKNNRLYIVAGFDFKNGVSNGTTPDGKWTIGGLFIANDQQPVYGTAASGSSPTNGAGVLNNIFGYDYVLTAWGFNPQVTGGTLNLYSLTNASTLKVWYGQNDESNPFDYNGGGTYKKQVNFTYQTGKNDAWVYTNLGITVLGGTHNIVDIALADLPLAGKNWLHLTQECGNDNLMGHVVPLPGAVLLLSAGLVRLAAYARRRQED